MESQYSVVLTGKVADGFALEDVKRNVGKLFKLDSAQLQKLFIGKPVALRRGVNKQQAIKFRNALLKAGAITTVKAVAAPAAGVDQATPPAAQPSKPQPRYKVAAVGATSSPAAKPVAKAVVKPTAVQNAAVKPSIVPQAAPQQVAAKPKPVETAPQSDNTLDCPRCGYEQRYATACSRCRMDLRLHIKRLERKAQIKTFRRQQQAQASR